MASKAVVFQNFSGGWATDAKYGVKGSAALVQSFDVRSQPSALSVLPAPVREDPGIIKGLPLAEVMALNGVIYMDDDQGFIYKRTTGGSWSDFGSMSTGCGGLDYRRDTDAIYLTSQKTVSAITGVVNGTPTLVVDKYASSISTYDNSAIAGFNVNADQEGSTDTTVIASTIVESQTASRFFQTDIEPCNQIAVFIVVAGGSDWTMTLHDGDNNVLGTSTITAGNIVSNAWNNFQFTTAPHGQVRLYPAPNARTYHIHLTSAGTAPTVSSSANNDLSSCDLRVYADRLVYADNGWHPMTRFLQYEIIGNGNYISAWEPISDPPTNQEWVRAQLTLPTEYNCTGVDHTNEFLVAAFEKVTSGTNTPQEGLIIFWDGTSATYNYDLPIPEGSPLALHVYENVVYYWADNSWWALTSPTTQPIHLRTMPGTDTNYSGTNALFRPYPNSATTRRGVQLMGWPGNSTSTLAQFGVWSWGAVDKNFPTVLSYNYAISTGSKTYSGSNNLKIGLVKNFGPFLHIGWRDDLNGGYGIDIVDANSPAAPTAVWQSLIVDNGYAGKYKTAKYCEVYYALQNSSQTVQLAYQFNRSGTWVVDPNIYSTTNLWQGRTGYARFEMGTNSDGSQGGRFREAQMQFTVTTSSGAISATPPQVFMAAIVYEDERTSAL